ncbi:NUP37 family WD repeat protein [Schizosaccharomyces japonicus yFS275]|uniref:NUP37 family WD repeat protein n=1 Tax=Schizosaccharomyces japonicus (strain yFS275 / FY16936) TaxID=402676 RepID=B6K0A1_SCHJY|nr:NUP37 family WD repeat protein [Schizosaccharomyces japonicus yFS275]EEB06251.1 NUP37 family WD repeat protein [Schizosaccharomyces japonicus yFS275]
MVSISQQNRIRQPLEVFPYTIKWALPGSSQPDIFAVGHETGITFYKPTAKPSTGAWPFRQLFTVATGLPTLHLAFYAHKTAPDSSENGEENSSCTLSIACACQDNSVRLIFTQDAEITSQHTFGGTSGHQNFVNDVDIIEIYSADQTLDEHVIASVGDDNTLIVWRVSDNGPVLAGYTLASPGVSVRFCRSDARRLLVGERNGQVRVFDWTSSGASASSSTADEVMEIEDSQRPWIVSLSASGVQVNAADTLGSAEWSGEHQNSILAMCKNGNWSCWELWSSKDSAQGAGEFAEVNGTLPSRNLLPNAMGSTSFSGTVLGARAHPYYARLFATASAARGSLQLVSVDRPHATDVDPVFLNTPIVDMSWHSTARQLAVVTHLGLELVRL